MTNQERSFGPLCEDLLVNIFCRLPERDVLKCKCVSKEWHILVSRVCVPLLSGETPVSGVYFRVAQGDEVPVVTTFCPQDSKDQLNHLVAYTSDVHYVGTAKLNPSTFPLNGSCVEVACSPEMSLSNLLPFNHRGPDFLDCCNGLVLFVQRPKPQFFVCNPTIRQCVPVPLPPPSIHLPSLYASLAFDPSESTEYRVVISTLMTQPQCLHVFDSQNGEWKTHEVEIELPTSAKSFKLLRHSVYLKNKVYRLSLFYKIFCFDLNSFEARVLDCPSQKSLPNDPIDAKEDQPPPGCIGVSNGFLTYISKEDGYLCVWLLDNPNESSVWTLKYKICSRYLLKNVAKEIMYGTIVWLRCCAFHPTSDILFLGCSYAIFVYHIGSGRVEAVRYLCLNEIHCGYFFPIFLHRNVLVTLKNWGTGINAKIYNYEDVEDRWCYIEQ